MEPHRCSLSGIDIPAPDRLLQQAASNPSINGKVGMACL
jgi:hypothetical protein